MHIRAARQPSALVLSFAILIGSLMTDLSSASAADPAARRTVTVTASGEVEAAPDRAMVTLGVSSEARTAAEALAANSEAMRNLIDGLKGLGIAARDVATSQFSVRPQYNHPKDGSKPRVLGYVVQNSVTALVRDLSQVGTVLDRGITLGANQASGVSFIVSKAETLLDEARRKAIANALRRAKLYAEAGGAEVGEVIAILEGSAPSSSGGPYFAVRAQMAQDSVPIEAGTQMLSASVQVTWALK